MEFAFILGLGRSGTQFLARALQRAPGAAVYHEPYPQDVTILHLRYAGFNQVADQMLEERFQTISPKSEGKVLHLETNSYLRYETAWLQSNLNATCIRLVRDGRQFVRSAYVRSVYTPHDFQQPIVVPQDGDPYASKWGSMDRFEKICWYWQHTNNMLAQDVPNGIQMEMLLTDYEAFHRVILAPLNLRIAEPVWRDEVSRPANTQARYRFRTAVRGLVGRSARYRGPTPLPSWEEWSDLQRDSFRRICGPTMEQLGYPF